MKFGKRKLAVALGAVLSVGMASQASADVYGLSHLNVDNLAIAINLTGGGADTYTFSGDQNARLNGMQDGSDGGSECDGTFGGGTNCSVAPPTLSGLVQNAPMGTVARGEGDFSKFGSVGNYSNSEAEVVEAVLTGDAFTQVDSISESNLDTGLRAQSFTNMGSNTELALTFAGGVGGTMSISFDAVIDMRTEVTEGDDGLAQAASGATFLLQRDGVALASWAPTGTNTVTTCDASLVCVATEADFSLNNTSTSNGVANVLTDSGSFQLDISGLTDGVYTLALNTTTSTDLIRRVQVPVPGTLLLIGTGLLMGARATRRKQK